MASSPLLAGTIDTVLKKNTCRRVAGALSVIAAEIRAGDTISQAFQKHEPLFGSFFCGMVMRGETSGNQGAAFMKLSEFYEKRFAFQKRMIRLLRYPLFIIFGASGCFVTLLLLLVQTSLRKALTGPENLPPLVRAAVSTIVFLQTHALEAALFSVFILVLVCLLRMSNLKSPWFSAISWRIPVAGEVIRKNSLQRFAHSLSTLLSSGFDQTHALTIAASELRNITHEKRILHALVETINGSVSIFGILKNLSVFPPAIMAMATDGMKTSQPDQYLKKIAAFYQNEVEAAFNAFAILAGPVFVMISGLLSAGVVVALYLPVFKLVGNY